MVNYLIFMQKSNGTTRISCLCLNEGERKRRKILSSGTRNFFMPLPPVASRRRHIFCCSRLRKAIFHLSLFDRIKFFFEHRANWHTSVKLISHFIVCRQQRNYVKKPFSVQLKKALDLYAPCELIQAEESGHKSECEREKFSCHEMCFAFYILTL